MVCFATVVRTEAFKEGLRPQTIIEHLTTILQEYSSDEQILKVKYYIVAVCIALTSGEWHINVLIVARVGRVYTPIIIVYDETSLTKLSVSVTKLLALTEQFLQNVAHTLLICN